MNIEYRDVFLRAERFLFECSECHALVAPGSHEYHTGWHEEERKRLYGIER